jgi:hypothetical protein
VLVIGVDGDRLDGGERPGDRQVEGANDGAGLDSDKLSACGGGLLGGHDVVEVRGPEEGQHPAAEPALFIG